MSEPLAVGMGDLIFCYGLAPPATMAVYADPFSVGRSCQPLPAACSTVVPSAADLQIKDRDLSVWWRALTGRLSWDVRYLRLTECLCLLARLPQPVLFCALASLCLRPPAFFYLPASFPATLPARGCLPTYGSSASLLALDCLYLTAPACLSGCAFACLCRRPYFPAAAYLLKHCLPACTPPPPTTSCLSFPSCFST
jgi:hypothetical protein